MSLWVTFPAKEELIAAGGTDWWRSPQHQIGNGPFVMTVNTGDTLTRFRPTSVTGEAGPRMTSSTDTWRTARQPSRRTRRATWTSPPFRRPTTAPVEGILCSAPASLTYPGSCTFALMFHNLKPPFTDPKVRQAFAYAID